jgi:RimJ/RimL family protein N-acetyltransferase
MAPHRDLETARFTLRPLGLEEAQLLADLGADPEVVKTLIGDWSTPGRRLAIARSWIEKHRDPGIWGVYDRAGAFGAEGRFVGFAAVDEPLPRVGRGPELSYAFARETWGRGVASEVVAAMIAHLISERGAEAVEALIYPGLNPASIRLADKLGMRLVGRFPLADYAGGECKPTLRFEVWRVSTATPEAAERALDEAAFKIGQFLAEGISCKDEMAAALGRAAAANGLTARLGEDAVGRVIDGRLEAGMADTGWLHYRVMAEDL